MKKEEIKEIIENWENRNGESFTDYHLDGSINPLVIIGFLFGKGEIEDANTLLEEYNEKKNTPFKMGMLGVEEIYMDNPEKYTDIISELFSISRPHLKFFKHLEL